VYADASRYNAFSAKSGVPAGKKVVVAFISEEVGGRRLVGASLVWNYKLDGEFLVEFCESANGGAEACQRIIVAAPRHELTATTRAFAARTVEGRGDVLHRGLDRAIALFAGDADRVQVRIWNAANTFGDYRCAPGGSNSFDSRPWAPSLVGGSGQSSLQVGRRI
jgi:hypothetical protein